MSLEAGQPIDSSIVNGTSVAAIIAPLGIQAIILPAVAFPAWIICLPPLVWHFRQGNMAAGSLILWVISAPFFLSINALIWPRDNLSEWWDGDVLCDIQARIQVATVVGATASSAMILRKLARVMDTNNMTVSSSHGTKLKEKVLEIVWCWLFPLLLVLVYYIVQPVRYIIWGIVGCLAAYDTSWPSIVLIFMWGPLTTLVAAGYACMSLVLCRQRSLT
jgi:pheromone a factor receptor